MERAVTVGLGQLAGDAVEFEDFDCVVQRYWPRVFRFALASLRDREAANTVAQECFLRAYRSRYSYRGEANHQTWLMRIAVNLVRDEVRSRRWKFWRCWDQGVAEAHYVDPLPSTEKALLAQERVRAVWVAAEKLPERQRTVFLLRFVEEMELLEIAAATGLTEGAVKNHLFRALRRVRTELGLAVQGVTVSKRKALL